MDSRTMYIWSEQYIDDSCQQIPSPTPCSRFKHNIFLRVSPSANFCCLDLPWRRHLKHSGPHPTEAKKKGSVMMLHCHPISILRDSDGAQEHDHCQWKCASIKTLTELSTIVASLPHVLYTFRVTSLTHSVTRAWWRLFDHTSSLGH